MQGAESQGAKFSTVVSLRRLDRFRKLLCVLTEIFVERHADVANEISALVADRKSVSFQLQQALALEVLQRWPLCRKTVTKTDLVCRLEGGEVNFEFAHQVLDDLSNEDITITRFKAANDGKISGIDRLIVFIQGSRILHVYATDISN